MPDAYQAAYWGVHRWNRRATPRGFPYPARWTQPKCG